jgi:hypothetical protein
MDTAFQSRIQIGIDFAPLNTDVRAEIWTRLLELSSSEGRIGTQVLRSVLPKIGQLAKFDLNGRQIRNALNVADGYAYNEFADEGKMEYRHILKAVEAAVEFQRLFDEARSNMKQGQSVWAPYGGVGAEADLS